MIQKFLRVILTLGTSATLLTQGTRARSSVPAGGVRATLAGHLPLGSGYHAHPLRKEGADYFIFLCCRTYFLCGVETASMFTP